jgi:hypothetical protein
VALHSNKNIQGLGSPSGRLLPFSQHPPLPQSCQHMQCAAIGIGLGIQSLRMQMYTWSHTPYLTHDTVSMCCVHPPLHLPCQHKAQLHHSSPPTPGHQMTTGSCTQSMWRLQAPQALSTCMCRSHCAARSQMHTHTQPGAKGTQSGRALHCQNRRYAPGVQTRPPGILGCGQPFQKSRGCETKASHLQCQ